MATGLPFPPWSDSGWQRNAVGNKFSVFNQLYCWYKGDQSDHTSREKSFSVWHKTLPAMFSAWLNKTSPKINFFVQHMEPLAASLWQVEYKKEMLPVLNVTVYVKEIRWVHWGGKIKWKKNLKEQNFKRALVYIESDNLKQWKEWPWTPRGSGF